jgi:molecular chaperone GrpE
MRDFMTRAGGFIMKDLEELQDEVTLTENHAMHLESIKIENDSALLQPDAFKPIAAPPPSNKVSGTSDNMATLPKLDIEEKLASVQDKIGDLQDAYLEAKDELENSHKHVQEDILSMHKYAIEDYSKALLSVKDRLEASLNVITSSPESMKEDINVILKQLDKILGKCNLIEISPIPGEDFDPTKHHAISMIPADQTPHTITGVLQTGYMIGHRVLRPALVMAANEHDGKEFAFKS